MAEKESIERFVSMIEKNKFFFFYEPDCEVYVERFQSTSSKISISILLKIKINKPKIQINFANIDIINFKIDSFYHSYTNDNFEFIKEKKSNKDIDKFIEFFLQSK